MDIKHNNHDDSTDFSLALGGPLYQFYLRSRLLKPPFELYKRRIVVISLFAWLPLLLLSMIGGVAFSGVKVPFLFDIDTHVRFLVALALLIAADLFVDRRMRIIVPQFIEHDIITLKNQPKFKDIIVSTMKLRGSIIIELSLLVFAFTCGHWIWKQFMALNVATWYSTSINNQIKLTSAGYWYVFVSLPLFQFFGFRWYFRIFVWYRFLWQVARLPLRFNSLHPDRAGGLGFLVGSMFAFAPILLAHTVLLAGIIANRIWHEGASLLQFKFEILGIIVFLLFLVVVPLTFFIFRLAQAKITGLREYSMTASHYVNNFRLKWINADSQNNNVLLGTPDIQSLADLSTSYNVVSGMRLVPFSRGVIFDLAILIILPLLPLVLTVIPLESMIKQVVSIIL